MSFPWISALTLTPLVGGLMVFGLREANRELAKRLALATALVALGLALGLFVQFDSSCGVLQTKTIERCGWIPTLGVEYFVGVDGLGLIMVLLTALLVPMAMFASWRQADRAE